ncbi:hypothetical protein CHN49_06910 [Pseudomonas putida]|nr:hypothetical protein CHN49_06910 [Pseudomonas putida]
MVFVQARQRDAYDKHFSGRRQCLPVPASSRVNPLLQGSHRGRSGFTREEAGTGNPNQEIFNASQAPPPDCPSRPGHRPVCLVATARYPRGTRLPAR